MRRALAMLAAVALIAAAGCAKKKETAPAGPDLDALKPTEIVKLFYESLEKAPSSEEAKKDPELARERKDLLGRATDLMALDAIREKTAGLGRMREKAALMVVGVILSVEGAMARPDVERVFHTEKVEGETATVGYTQIAGPEKVRTERTVELIRERGGWRILRVG